MEISREIGGLTAVWWREFKIFQREKSRVISALASPLLWLAIVGTGVGSIAEESELGGTDYRTFIFPGVVAMSILFGTLFYGLYIVWDRKLDVLKEILVAPVSRLSIFAGKVLGGCTDALIQTVLLLVIGFFFLLPERDPVGILLALGIAGILAATFTALGLAIGSFFESLEGFQVVVSFVAFPLFFLSGALFPVDENLPPALQYIALANPVTYSVDAMRGVLLGVHRFPLALDLTVAVAFCAATIVFGSWAFSRMR
ncbi:MAG: ABC transporter permease [Methanobacteriota archaeon]